jgi:hypothetical protein
MVQEKDKWSLLILTNLLFTHNKEKLWIMQKIKNVLGNGRIIGKRMELMIVKNADLNGNAGISIMMRGIDHGKK